MGRPREFEIEDALEASADAFWTGGFEGTSLDDLMAATGLHKGSLYKAFDGKQDLFQQSLAHYLAKVAAYHRESFAQESSPKAAIRNWFLRSADFCTGEDGSFRGCLAMNTISEMGADDPDVTQVLMGYYQRMMAVIAQIVADGQAAGEFRADLEPEKAAAVLFAQMGGFNIGLRAGLPLEASMASVDHLLDLMSP